MLKQERQRKILNLIRAKPIGTQEALRAHLERAGVPATQSSVSRDLEELGIVKNHGKYALPHVNGDSRSKIAARGDEKDLGVFWIGDDELSALSIQQHSG